MIGSFSGRFQPFLGQTKASNSKFVRTTISPAVFIGFFQYRTQGIITMSRASWEKLFFFSGHFRAVFCHFQAKKGLLTNVRTYRLISCRFYRILSLSHTGHHYNVAGVMEETSSFFSGHFRAVFCPFLGKNQNSLNSFNIAHRTSLPYREHHKKKLFYDRVIFGPFSAIFRLERPQTQNSLNSFNIAHRTSLPNREHHKKKLFYDQVIFGLFSAIFRLKKATKSKFVKNGKKNLKKITKNS